MASLICKCGVRLSNSNVPNEVQYYVYSDAEWGDILNKDTVNTWEIPKPKNDVWKCPNCGRVYVFDEDGSVIKKYVQEND